MDFNQIIDRRGTHCSQWDGMQAKFGVSPKDGLGMWTADSNYATAPCVREELQRWVDHGIFGYTWEYPEYKDAVVWWMKNRHGWEIDADWVLTTQGLGNGIALCLDVWSEPGDTVAIFPPVYHEFRIKIENAGRVVTECPLVRDGDSYALDLEDAQSRLTGTEKLLIWCSPQNPSGRIWTVEELRAVSEFAKRNGMILVSDEIHHDLVYAGNKYVPTDVAVPDGRAHTVYLTAASKTFNIAGMRTGNMIIPDPDLRMAMKHRLHTLNYSPASLGLHMICAAYTPEGAAWVDEQMAHLDGNRQLFDAGMQAIPGVWSMPLQSTFLAWVDFAGTGMAFEEFRARIRDTAKIAASPGPQFGTGGETWMRFNLAAPRPMIEDAVGRLQTAFSDLQ